MSDFDNRFGGTRRLYGAEEVEKLRRANICVIGIGGVGSWCAEALARTGIGHITLIDLDDICSTNINRQIHALSHTVGQAKTDVMKERILAINPDCQVSLIDDFVNTDNVADYLDQSFDYVIDAIDSVRDKVAIIAFCKRRKIPIITIGGAGGQTDPSCIAITDLSRTIQDPLLAKVRSQLRRDHGFSKNTKRKFSIEAVYSTEQLVYPQADGSVCAQKSEMKDGTRLDCSGGFGAATMVTASFGFFAVARIVKKLVSQSS